MLNEASKDKEAKELEKSHLKVGDLDETGKLVKLSIIIQFIKVFFAEHCWQSMPYEIYISIV